MVGSAKATLSLTTSRLCRCCYFSHQPRRGVGDAEGGAGGRRRFGRKNGRFLIETKTKENRQCPFPWSSCFLPGRGSSLKKGFQKPIGRREFFVLSEAFAQKENRIRSLKRTQLSTRETTRSSKQVSAPSSRLVIAPEILFFFRLSASRVARAKDCCRPAAPPYWRMEICWSAIGFYFWCTQSLEKDNATLS